MTNKIDINKQYKTRSGLPFRAYAIDCGEVHGAFYENGKWNADTWLENNGIICSHNWKRCEVYSLIPVGKYDNIRIDDKVLVWNPNHAEKIKGHFAGLNLHGLPCIWKDGRTSFTENKVTVVFDNCELYTGE